MVFRVRNVAVFITAVCAIEGLALADTVRLKDKTTVSGDVLQVDDDNVLIRLPREKIATVNGQELPPPLNEGAAAPAFTAVDLAGNKQSVGSGKAKVTLLHFWVHWCPHCRSDAPQIEAIYDRYKDDPTVKVITVNLDKQKQKVESVVKERNMLYPVVMAFDPANHSAESEDIQDLYQITGFPATFLIDGQGVIRFKRRGSFAEGHEDLKAEIEKLLAQQGVKAAKVIHSGLSSS